MPKRVPWRHRAAISPRARSIHTPSPEPPDRGGAAARPGAVETSRSDFSTSPINPHPQAGCRGDIAQRFLHEPDQSSPPSPEPPDRGGAAARPGAVETSRSDFSTNPTNPHPQSHNLRIVEEPRRGTSTAPQSTRNRTASPGAGCRVPWRHRAAISPRTRSIHTPKPTTSGSWRSRGAAPPRHPSPRETGPPASPHQPGPASTSISIASPSSVCSRGINGRLRRGRGAPDASTKTPPAIFAEPSRLRYTPAPFRPPP